MKINSVQNQQDSLYHDAKTILGILTTSSDLTSYPLNEFFRSANDWNRQTHTLIMKTQSAWRYDDSNFTDFPEATTPLVNNQQDYTLPSTAQTIKRVEVLDGNGNYQPLTLITLQDIIKQGYSVSEFYKTAGLPVFYMLDGRSILLFPKPASGQVTLTAGLKVYFDRNADAFSITDTSTVPGFETNFHRLISCGAALDFAQSRQLINSINILTPKLSSLKSDLIEFYSSRAVEEKPQIRITRDNCI
jgi:hypothetical protein